MTTDPAAMTLREKECRRCRLVKSVDSFGRHASHPDGLQKWCRDCRHDAQIAYRVRYNERINAATRERHRRTNFGIEDDVEFDAMLEAQGGGCAVCGSPEPEGRRHAVDHDHSSGVTRGILCTGCNRGIGFFQDNPELLRAAATYLETR